MKRELMAKDDKIKEMAKKHRAEVEMLKQLPSAHDAELKRLQAENERLTGLLSAAEQRQKQTNLNILLDERLANFKRAKEDGELRVD